VKLNELGAPQGANKRTKRRGRGPGSGHGKNACRGRKGALKRSGRTTRPGFEGGQMPLIRRIPKKGFSAPFKVIYQVVNVGSLNRFDKDAVVGPTEFKKAGLITSDKFPVKILGGGTLDKALTVKAHKFSESSKKVLQSIGAKMDFLAPQEEPKPVSGPVKSKTAPTEAKKTAPVQKTDDAQKPSAKDKAK